MNTTPYPAAASFAEQDTEDKILSDGQAPERIVEVFGKFITFITDWNATVDFHGLPESLKKTEEEDQKPRLWLPHNFLEKQTELEKWERIYQVHKIGPDVWADGETPWFKEGDHVILAGTVARKLSNPTIWVAYRENVVAKVDVKRKKVLSE